MKALTRDPRAVAAEAALAPLPEDWVLRVMHAKGIRAANYATKAEFEAALYADPDFQRLVTVSWGAWFGRQPWPM